MILIGICVAFWLLILSFMFYSAGSLGGGGGGGIKINGSG